MKKTFQYFKQRLDEAIKSFSVDSQELDPSDAEDFFLKHLQDNSRFSWINRFGNNLRSGLLSYSANLSDEFDLILDISQDTSKNQASYFVSLSIQNYKYYYSSESKKEVIFEKRIETADKVALVFIKHIDEIIQRHFVKPKPKVDSMKADVLGFDQ